MTQKQTDNEKRAGGWWPYLWLAAGIALSVFSSGQWVIPLAAWLAPIFLLRFVRTQRALVGYLLVAVTAIPVIALTWRNIIPLSGPMLAGFVVSMAFTANLPYLADRLLAPRLNGFAGTLVFPLVWTALEFLSMSGNPLGSWGALAYSQYGNLALLQLLSVTGLWGIAFLMTWLASIVNWAWERDFAWPEIRGGVLLYAGILALVLLFGGARLTFAAPPAGTVRVASITAVDMRPRIGPLMQFARSDREEFRTRTKEIHDRYFEDTRREVGAGAQVVAWPEVAAMVAAEDEAALLSRGRELARQDGIYLAMPLVVMPEQEASRPVENKLIVVDPAGEVVLEHYKYGGNIIEGTKAGDRVLRTVETEHGTLSGVICWDMDFPGVIRQAGQNNTDVMLAPSNDWREIDPLHSHMATFRAIENGMAVVRPVDNGLAIAVDSYGRVLAETDHFVASERVMVAQVPTRGVSTLYAVVGDVFGWLTVAGFVVVAVWAVVRSRKEPGVPKVSDS